MNAKRLADSMLKARLQDAQNTVKNIRAAIRAQKSGVALLRLPRDSLHRHLLDEFHHDLREAHKKIAIAIFDSLGFKPKAIAESFRMDEKKVKKYISDGNDLVGFVEMREFHDLALYKIGEKQQKQSCDTRGNRSKKS